MLIGNKSDLNHMRQIESEEGAEFAKKNQTFFFETSALSNTNVAQAFESLVEEIYNSKKKKETISGNTQEVKVKQSETIKIEHEPEKQDPTTLQQKPGCSC